MTRWNDDNSGESLADGLRDLANTMQTVSDDREVLPHQDVTKLSEWMVIKKDESGKVFVPWGKIDVQWLARAVGNLRLGGNQWKISILTTSLQG